MVIGGVFYNMKSKISILVSTEAPAPSKEPKQTLADKVDDMIIAIESNLMDSEYEMNYLTCLYKKLCKCKRLKPEYQEIQKKIKDILFKHGKYNSSVQALDPAKVSGYNLDNGYTDDDY